MGNELIVSKIFSKSVACFNITSEATTISMVECGQTRPNQGEKRHLTFGDVVRVFFEGIGRIDAVGKLGGGPNSRCRCFCDDWIDVMASRDTGGGPEWI